MGYESIPSKPAQRQSRRLLRRLLRRKTGRQIGEQPLEIAEPTGTQQAGLDILKQFAGSAFPSGMQTGLEHMEGTVRGDYDPMTSPYWKGYRDYSGRQENEAVAATRRFYQTIGMDVSTPAQQAEMSKRAGFAANRDMVLGQLFDTERSRQISTAPQLISSAENVAGYPARKAQTLISGGEFERDIDQQRNQARYKALIESLLFPYLKKAPIAQQLINEPRYVYQAPAVKSSGGGSDWMTWPL